MTGRQRRREGTTESERRALLVLRDKGLMSLYSHNDKVVLECGHVQVIDSPVRRGGKYRAFCQNHENWYLIERRAKTAEPIGGNTKGEADELW